jgi:hypothetical protein
MQRNGHVKVRVRVWLMMTPQMKPRGGDAEKQWLTSLGRLYFANGYGSTSMLEGVIEVLSSVAEHP